MWFNSQLLNDKIVDENCLVKKSLYKDYVNDLVKLNVNKENYAYYIKEG